MAGALGAAFLAALGWCPAAIADVPASAVSDAAGGMDDAQPCDELAAFTCSTLRVPIGHDGEVAGSFDLAVAVSDNDQAPGGVLLFLAGGPGQAGVATAPRVVERYLDPLVLEHFRLVMFDQRGTGAAAIDCGPLQAAVGGSDYLTPPRRAVEECGEHLDGQRDFLSTADTVGDIELLRRALGAEEMVIDGVSYGTFTAAHYALAYPQRVAALVLDSVVPQDGFDPFARTEMSAAARVLADACADARCSSDPVAELARLVGDGTVAGPALIEMLAVSSLSSVEPSMTGVIDALADAGDGDVDGLRRLLAEATSVGLPAWQLSAGLHLATICTDQRFPWGDSSTPLPQRQPALDEALAGLRPADIAPFDVARRVAARHRRLPVLAGVAARPLRRAHGDCGTDADRGRRARPVHAAGVGAAGARAPGQREVGGGAGRRPRCTGELRPGGSRRGDRLLDQRRPSPHRWVTT